MILALLEENYIEKISAYTMVDWKPLLELIPKIEGAKIFGRVAGVDKDKNKSNTFPY